MGDPGIPAGLKARSFEICKRIFSNVTYRMGLRGGESKIVYPNASQVHSDLYILAMHSHDKRVWPESGLPFVWR